MDADRNSVEMSLYRYFNLMNVVKNCVVNDPIFDCVVMVDKV